MLIPERMKTRDEIREMMQTAIKEGNTEGFYQSMMDMMEVIDADVKQQYDEQLEQKISEVRQDMDAKILANRGVRQLTSEERKYYQKLGDAIKSNNPKQALDNLGLSFPDTVINAVFEELRTNHPLLRRLNFITTGAAVKMLINTNGYQTATWGELCDEIVKELLGGFKAVDTNLLKLSAFLPVCKQALELGPEWLDNFVRQTLYEAFAAGLEVGFVDGTGNKMPIGMNRYVADDANVVGGVWPKKTAIEVTSFDIVTMGGLVGLLAIDGSGKDRAVNDLIMVVNPVDYFTKVMPAMMIMGADGVYRNIMPYPIDVIPSAAVARGEAIFGIAKKYAALIGSPKEGRIDYSDHYQFLEDNRVYLIKGFANGFPADNNSFLLLDISGLQPAVFKFMNVTPPDPSDDATLSALSLGTATLSPAFAAATTIYTASTTNASNTINALPNNAAATIKITLTNTTHSTGIEVTNGSAITWDTGSNTVAVEVTAEDGTTTKTYTVTVTKS